MIKLNSHLSHQQPRPRRSVRYGQRTSYKSTHFKQLAGTSAQRNVNHNFNTPLSPFHTIGSKLLILPLFFVWITLVASAKIGCPFASDYFEDQCWHGLNNGWLNHLQVVFVHGDILTFLSSTRLHRHSHFFFCLSLVLIPLLFLPLLEMFLNLFICQIINTWPQLSLCLPRSKLNHEGLETHLGWEAWCQQGCD